MRIEIWILSQESRKNQLKSLLSDLSEFFWFDEKIKINVLSDFSLEQEKKFSNVFFVPNHGEKNIAVLRNLAISYCRSNILIFLDDDVQITKMWKKVIKGYLLTGFPQESIVFGPSIEKPKEQVVSRAINFLYLKDFFLNENFSTPQKHLTVFGIDTKNLIINFQKIEKNKVFFDEKITKFNTFEDVEFGFRLKKKHILIKYEPNLLVFHQGEKRIQMLIGKTFRAGRGYLIFTQNYEINSTGIVNELKYIGLILKVFFKSSRSGPLSFIKVSLVILILRMSYLAGMVWERGNSSVKGRSSL